jgi:ABC-type glycerol-3-phosphate transport system substrate-binding protein
MANTDFVSPLPPRRVMPEVEEEKTETVVATTEDTVISEPVLKKPFPKILLLIPIIILLIVVVIAVVGSFKAKNIKNGQVVLNYWGLWEDASIMDGVIADFEAKNPGIKVNYVKNQKVNYRSRLQGRLAKDATTEEVPDVFRIHSSWLPMLKTDLAKVPAGVTKSIGLETDFYKVFERDLKIGGNYVAVPLMYDGLALFYNKDLLEAIAAKPPRTWWDLKTTAEKLTVRDDTGVIKVAGAALGMADNVDHWSDIVGLLMKQMGADVWKNDVDSNKKIQEVLTFTPISRQVTEFGMKAFPIQQRYLPAVNWGFTLLPAGGCLTWKK